MEKREEDLPDSKVKGYLTPDGVNALVKAITLISDDPNLKYINKLTDEEKENLLQIVQETTNEPDLAIERKTVILNPDGVKALVKAISHISDDPHVRTNNILSKEEKNDLLNIIPKTPSEPDEAIERKTVILNPDGVKALVKAMSNISDTKIIRSSEILNKKEINDLLNPE